MTSPSFFISLLSFILLFPLISPTEDLEKKHEVQLLRHHDSIRVCEISLESQSSSGFSHQGYKTCSLCVNVPGNIDLYNNIQLTKDNSQSCGSFENFAGDCVISKLDEQKSPKDDDSSCSLKKQQLNAESADLKGLLFPVQKSDVDVSGVEFKVPTFFLPQSSYNILAKKGLFNESRSTFLSAKSFADASWTSNTYGIVFLALVATLNIISAIFLQKYDIEFEMKQLRFKAMRANSVVDDNANAAQNTITNGTYRQLSDELVNEDTAPIEQEQVETNNQDHNQANDVNSRSNEVDVHLSGIINEDSQDHSPAVDAGGNKCGCGKRSSTICGNCVNGDANSGFMSILSIFFAILITVVVLSLVFFFHQVFWYVMVVLYMMWTCLAFSSFGVRLYDRFMFGIDLSQKGTVSIFFARFAPGFLIGACLAAFWFILLDKEKIWVLWDGLSFAICLYILTSARFPSMKWLSLLCFAFLVYDGIAVYVTPLFTESGRSVMEQAALGPDDGEPQTENKRFLPIMFLVEFGFGRDTICVGNSYNILGMGDVVIPGFLIVHSSIYGMKSSHKPTIIYAVVAILAYVSAYVFVYISLMVMESGQPVLVFVIPVLLGSLFAVAAMRNEFNHFIHSRGVVPSLPKRPITFENT